MSSTEQFDFDFDVDDLVIPASDVHLDRLRRVIGYREDQDLTVKRIFKDGEYWYAKIMYKGELFSVYAERLKRVGPPLTKEEKVIKKINKLWERQHYYKNYIDNRPEL